MKRFYLFIIVLMVVISVPLATKADDLTNRLKGRILLQVESKGEAWYVNPQDGKRSYMADGDQAFQIMKTLGVGISNKNLDKIKTDANFRKKFIGKIFLQVEAHGEAYYISFDGRYNYLKDGASAYEVMRRLGLGISNNNLNKLAIKEEIDTWACGSNISFTYNNVPVTYGTVLNPTTSKCWLDRNLGATRVAQTSTDYLAYGDLFQWGRGDDGHQSITWTGYYAWGLPVNVTTTDALSLLDTPGHNKFILAPDSPHDWRSPQNDNLWQGINGVNNPCPSGFRIPTDIELTAEINSWSSKNPAGALVPL